ncbi:nitric oxide-sensing transcriptional repressor NsrR [soil metagenome]
MYLARAKSESAPVTVAEIAMQFELSTYHLVKVVGHLSRAGWVETRRGRQGGLRLSVDPAHLQIGMVLRELEGEAELVDCETQACRLKQDCVLRSALQAGLRAFYSSMDTYTLTDISGGATGEQIVRMHRNILTIAASSDSRLM